MPVEQIKFDGDAGMPLEDSTAPDLDASLACFEVSQGLGSFICDVDTAALSPASPIAHPAESCCSQVMNLSQLIMLTSGRPAFVKGPKPGLKAYAWRSFQRVLHGSITS